MPATPMRRDILVYLSGPMTAKNGYSIESNVAAGVAVFLDCLRLGIPAFCPHLCGGYPSCWSAIEWETWLEYDKAVIDRCTAMIMLPRWETSTGAVAEMQYAKEAGVPVFLSMPSFLGWLKRRDSPTAVFLRNKILAAEAAMEADE